MKYLLWIQLCSGENDKENSFSLPALWAENEKGFKQKSNVTIGHKVEYECTLYNSYRYEHNKYGHLLDKYVGTLSRITLSKNVEICRDYFLKHI